MRTIEQLVAKHPFFEDLEQDDRALLAGCGRNEAFHKDQYLTREGEPADRFYVIREGRVSIEIHVPAGGPAVIQTANAGDVVGVSWLFDPTWNFDARATATTRVLRFDTACLHDKCESDPRFGYHIMRKFSALIMSRLQAARLRLLDMYGYGQSA